MKEKLPNNSRRGFFVIDHADVAGIVFIGIGMFQLPNPFCQFVPASRSSCLMSADDCAALAGDCDSSIDRASSGSSGWRA